MFQIKHLNIWEEHQWIDNLIDHHGSWYVSDLSKPGYLLTKPYTFNGAIRYEGFEVTTSDCMIAYAPGLEIADVDSIPENLDWYSPMAMLGEILQYKNPTIQFLVKATGKYGKLKEIKIGYHLAENAVEYILRYPLRDVLENIIFTRSLWVQSNPMGEILIPQGINLDRIEKIWVREKDDLASEVNIVEESIAAPLPSTIYQLIIDHRLRCEVLLSEYLQISEIPCLMIEHLSAPDLYKPHWGETIQVSEEDIKQIQKEYWGHEKIRITAVGQNRTEAYSIATTTMNIVAMKNRVEAFALDQVLGLQIISPVNTTPSFSETEPNLGNGFAVSFDIALYGNN